MLQSPISKAANSVDDQSDIDELHQMSRKVLEEALLRERAQYESLIQSTSAILWRGDPKTLRFHFVSDQAEVLLGLSPREWVNEPDYWQRHIHPDDRDWAIEYCTESTRQLRDHDFEYRMIAADGRVVWLRDIVRVMAKDGEAVELVGVMVDITQAKEAQLALAHVSELQQMLVEISGQMIGARADETENAIKEALARIGDHCGVHRSYLFRFDESAQVMREDHEWSRSGTPPMIDRLQSRPFAETPRIVEWVCNRRVLVIPDVSALGDGWEQEKAILEAQGARSLVVVPVVAGDQLEGHIGFDDVERPREWSDAEIRALQSLADLIGAVSQRARAAQRLDENRTLLEMAGRTARIGGWRADLVAREIVMTPEACDILGFPAGASFSLSEALNYYTPDSRALVHARFQACATRGIPYDEELEMIGPVGEVGWVREIGEPVRDESGHIVQVRGSIQDITERRRARQEIEFLALYDPLTHLPNRRLLNDRLEHAIAVSRRAGTAGAVLFLDIDQFKTVNDTLGHDVGDELLRQAARRLQACVRASDTVARLGGDEFTIVLPDLEAESEAAAAQARAVSDKILHVMMEPYELVGGTRQLTVSIGCALFVGSDEDTVAELMKRADLAMYRAKVSGRNAVCVYTPDMQDAVHSRVSVENDLRGALERGEFEPWYQPLVDCNHRISGVELLLRWVHPERGILLPGEFISIAEDTGLIIPLGEHVLRLACQQLVEWQADSVMRDLDVAVNISARQFHHPEFAEQVIRLLHETGAPADRLWLELTETLLLEDVDDTVRKMTRLKSLGVRFSLDDFGTGYSSLAYLKRLPLDLLKIDQSFVRDTLMDPNDDAIVRTIIVLARSLEMSVLAEGVETEPVLTLLAGYGCDWFQGYLFGRPMPLREFEDGYRHRSVGECTG